MKGITLYEPWATLIAEGVKRFETRSWRTSYTGLLAIHAGKTIDHFFLGKCQREGLITGPVNPGTIVAVATLNRCWRTEDIREALRRDELTVGDFRDNRWAWELDSVARLREPIALKGSMGLWSVSGQLQREIIDKC